MAGPIPIQVLSCRGFYRRTYFRGVQAAMSLDWVPGVGVAALGSFLSLWRGAATTNEKVLAIRDEVDKLERRSDEFEREMRAELRELVERLSGIITRLEMVATEQAAAMRMATRTLEGVSNRLEVQSTMLMNHQADIAVLKEKGNKG